MSNYLTDIFPWKASSTEESHSNLGRARYRTVLAAGLHGNLSRDCGREPLKLASVGKRVCNFPPGRPLLWIVTRWELLPLTSIGLRGNMLRTSLLRGLWLAAIVLSVTVGLYLLLRGVGIHLGEDRGGVFHPSLLVVTVSMLRAGVAEEIFYRGLPSKGCKASRQQSFGWAGAARNICGVTLPAGHRRYRRGIRAGWNSYRILYEISRPLGQYHGAFPRRFCAPCRPTRQWRLEG